ncbi:MAG: hypothetical protein ACT4PI_14780 [Actinomycetota bacterium]
MRQESRPGAVRDRRFLLVLALTLLPLLVSAVALVVDVGTTYHAWGDQALIELQTRDVSRHPVLVGLYSREGWNHFGPALFYLLAVPYHLTGGNSIGLHLGALLINGAAIAGMAVIAKRRGGTPLLLLSLLGTAVLVRTLGPDFLHDPWVPFIAVLPFGLLVFLAWAMTSGDAWALPVGVGVAVFCMQTHAGYVLIALPLVLAGAAWLVVGSVRAGQPARTDLRRAGLVAAAVVAVASIPPAIEQLTNSPGNLTEVAEYTNQGDPDEGRQTWADGARVAGDQFTLTPEWVTGADAANPFTGEPAALDTTPVPGLLVPFLLAVIVAIRRRWTDAARLGGTVATALVLGVLSITRVIGNLFVYRLRWTWVLGMLAIVTVAWVGWKLLSARTAAAERWLAPVALAVLVPVSAVSAVSAARAGIPYEREATALPPIASDVVDALPERDGEVVVRSDTFSGNLYAAALVLLLEQRGIDIGVERANEEAFGEHRVHREGRVRATLVVYEGLDTLVPRPELRLVATSSDPSRAERTRLTKRRAALDAEHEAGTIGDERYIVELGKIEARVRSAVAVFTEPEK